MKHTRKRIVSIICAIVSITAFCLAVHCTVNPTFVCRSRPDTAVTVAESWLKKQISLQDYKVTEAHFFAFEDPKTHYVAMTYSVQPKPNTFANWYSGNGTDGENGWITDKYGFISYRMIGPIVLTGIGCNTGP